MQACKVLIVDDHPDIREGVRILLEDSGYEAVLAENGQEALRQLCRLEYPPCIILLDLMMPLMDGWQLMEELQRNALFSKIPVAVISASNLDVRSFSHAAAYLKKPINYRELYSILERACSVKGNFVSDPTIDKKEVEGADSSQEQQTG